MCGRVQFSWLKWMCFSRFSFLKGEKMRKISGGNYVVLLRWWDVLFIFWFVCREMVFFPYRYGWWWWFCVKINIYFFRVPILPYPTKYRAIFFYTVFWNIIPFSLWFCHVITGSIVGVVFFCWIESQFCFWSVDQINYAVKNDSYSS